MSDHHDADPVEAVKEEITATREDLAETVNELSDRLNPKKQAGAAAHEAAVKVTQAAEQARGATRGRGRQGLAAAGVVLAIVAVIVWRKRR